MVAGGRRVAATAHGALLEMTEERIKLMECEAEPMGDGIFTLMHDTPEGLQTITVQRADLEALLAAC
jgi:hypothetical protein